MSSGTANYGVLQIGTSLLGGGGAYSGSTSAQYIINFSLSDPNLPANTPITLSVPVNYDVTLSVNGGGSGGSANGVDFALYLDSAVNPFWLYRVASSSDSSGNICSNPAASLPSCNGRYVGTVTASLNTFINGGTQRLWITANDQATLNSSGGASVDALHTVTLGSILLPNGVSYVYDSGITGNPANFTYATTPSPVPEPSGLMLMAGGLGLFWRGRRKARV